MKIKKIQTVKPISPISANLQRVHKKLKAQSTDFVREKVKRPHTSLKANIQELRDILKANKNGMTVTNAIPHFLNIRRKERMQTQLKVFFISSVSKGVFKFVVKSSGLGDERAYNVEIAFKDVDTSIALGIPKDDILMKSNIQMQCSCKDFTFRFRYWLTKMNAILGRKEHRPPKKTNPHPFDDHRFLCKHSALVLRGITKPAFKDNIFKRFIDGKINKKHIRVSAKDKNKTIRSSHSIR